MRRRNVLVLSLTSMFNDIGSEMILPILPLFIVNVVGAPALLLGLIEGIAQLTASALYLVSGALSDKLGKRKPLIVCGYGLSAATKPFFAAATSWLDVLFVRFADRIGKGVRGAPRDALLAASVIKRVRGGAFGLRQALDTSGAIVGTLIVAWLLSMAFDYRAIFLLAFIPSFISVLTVLFAQEISHAPRRIWFDLKLTKKLKFFLFIVGIFSIGNFSYAFFILRAQHVGLQIYLIPIIYLVYCISSALLAYPSGRLSDKIGRKFVIALGYFVFVLTAIGMAYVGTPALLWPLFILYGAQAAIIDSVSRAYISDMVIEIKRASAIGAYHMVVGLCALPASLIAGYLWDAISPQATFLFAALTSCVSLALLLGAKD